MEISTRRANLAARRLDAALVKIAGLETRAEDAFASARARFVSRMDAEASANAAMLVTAFARHFGASTARPRLVDVVSTRQDAREEWERHAAALRTRMPEALDGPDGALGVMEDRLLRRFAGMINADRQQALGVDRYVWRSKDDARVRDDHAAYDDKVFSWDDPPEGGHPGEAYNCRCFAEPFWPDVEDYVPRTGVGFELAKIDAEFGGFRDASLEALAAGAAEAARAASQIYDLLDDPRRIVDAARAVQRFYELFVKQNRGELTPEDAAELEAIRQKVLDGIARFAPADLLKALDEYIQAAQSRPAIVEAAYAKGLATEADVFEARRERGSALGTFVAIILGGRELTRVFKRVGRNDHSASTDIEWLRGLAARLRNHPSKVDWPAVRVHNMKWASKGAGIEQQGDAWEDYLEARSKLGQRTPSTLKTFDFYELASGTATSAKTLDTRSPTAVTRPSTIYAKLRRYIDDVRRFEMGKMQRGTLRKSNITHRRLELAIPFDTMPEQIIQIRRAIAYAEQYEIIVNVSFLR